MTSDPNPEQPKLRTLIAELTPACNHRCQHCYNVWKNSAPYPDGQLSPTEWVPLWKKILDETGVSQVTLTGGEPLLRTDLEVLVDFFHQRGVRLNLITNGSLLTESRLTGLLGKIGMYELPLLADEPELHDALSGQIGAFDRVVQAIGLLKKHQQPLVLVFVATAKNLLRWNKTLELAFALGADGVMFNRFNPGGEGLRNFGELAPTPEALRQALTIAETFSIQHQYPIHCSIPMPPCLFEHSDYPHLNFGFCAAGTDRAYYTVDPMGNLRPCNHSPQILGNLQHTRFQDLISSSAMQAFIQARPEFCRACKHVTLCAGSCKAAAQACLGSCLELDPWVGRYQGHIAMTLP